MKILNIVGARPNLMKIAPLCRAMTAHPRINPILVHTGQHYDDNLSGVFFEQLGIPEPDRHLGVGTGSREEQITRIMGAFEPVLLDEKPDLVLVVGDVNSTVACARVARDNKVPVAHVEAGLRSFDPMMPEELNRKETDEIADFLFVTEPAGIENLAREQAHGQSWLVGNVMIDTLVYNLERVQKSTILTTLALDKSGYALATFHRPSNVDNHADLSAVIAIIRDICQRIKLVLPLHPRTRNSLNHHGLTGELESIGGLTLTEPLGYLDFLKLLCSARAVITDSGGIQEETTYLGIPCLTMRENTERPITIEEGSNVLVGGDHRRLLSELDRVLDDRFKKGQVPDLWDGHTAERIIEILVERLPVDNR
jgi:UDP-N-acetylglucosamine 2-epimerase (non-hydrolysing)